MSSQAGLSKHRELDFGFGFRETISNVCLSACGFY